MGFPVPSSSNIKDYQIQVQKMAENDNPAFFGLPHNIDKAVQRYNTETVYRPLHLRPAQAAAASMPQLLRCRGCFEAAAALLAPGRG